MYCPFCHYIETKVVDSRLGADGMLVRRRRECAQCATRFSTFESPEPILPTVIKQSGRREAFDEEKLRYGMIRSLEKRSVQHQQIDTAVTRLIGRLHERGEREIPSKLLGDWVMEALKTLDEVAYVRFASVYHRFQNLQAFDEQIQKLRKETDRD